MKLAYYSVVFFGFSNALMVHFYRDRRFAMLVSSIKSVTRSSAHGSSSRRKINRDLHLEWKEARPHPKEEYVERSSVA